VKRLSSILLLAALVSAGCVTFPKGVHPWAGEVQRRNEAMESASKQDPNSDAKPDAKPESKPEAKSAAKPEAKVKPEPKTAGKAATPAPSVPKINPDEVNEQNTRSTIRKLEAEIRNDERSN
jgi:hypothetical protein